MKKNDSLPFRYEEKEIMAELLEEVGAALKDSDAVAEKEMVREFLHSVSERITFVALGKKGAGKTSLLDELFQGALLEGEEIQETIGICEFRYGEAKTTFQVRKNEVRHFKQKEELRGISVIDTGNICQLRADGMLGELKGYLEKSDVILAVFQADSVRDHDLWDVLEEMDKKKVVFVLTKCDRVTQERLEMDKADLKRYMREAGISAPLFPVSSEWSKAKKPHIFENDGKDGCEDARQYVRKNVIGSNPVLTKQQDNIKKLKTMLAELNTSFDLRKRQYHADAKILTNINGALDSFCLESRDKIDRLKEDLKVRIYAALEEYQNEVIVKLDPKKIKERFPGGISDFIDYVKLINESYQKKMTDQASREMQKSVQAYLSDLEDVFDEATGYFRKRESLLKLEDKFYGTLAESKNKMVKNTERSLLISQEYYHSLAEASEELFLKIWDARNARERTERNAQIAGFVTGAAGTGAMEALMVAKTDVIIKLAVMGKGAVVAGALFGGLAVVVSGMIVMKMAKKIFSAKSMEEMERKTHEAIGDFKAEVKRIKEELTEQVFSTVEDLFQAELGKMDKTFADFRKSVNIDGKNIPILEERMKKTAFLMEKINMLEEKMQNECGK